MTCIVKRGSFPTEKIVNVKRCSHIINMGSVVVKLNRDKALNWFCFDSSDELKPSIHSMHAYITNVIQGGEYVESVKANEATT